MLIITLLDILALDILGLDILGLDILGLDILGMIQICELDGEFSYREFCYHEAFGAPKRVFPRLADNTDNMFVQNA